MHFNRSIAALTIAGTIAAHQWPPTRAAPVQGIVQQCDAIGAIVNRAARDAQQFDRQGGDQLTNLLRTADRLDRYAQELTALQLQDNRLRGIRRNFVQIYRQASQSSRQFVTAVRQRNRPAAEQALRNLQTADEQATRLVTEGNAYCRNGEVRDMNTELKRAVDAKRWDEAIVIIDQMIVRFPDREPELLRYRAQLERLRSGQ